jgi:hypothetical protein
VKKTIMFAVAGLVALCGLGAVIAGVSGGDDKPSAAGATKDLPIVTPETTTARPSTTPAPKPTTPAAKPTKPAQPAVVAVTISGDGTFAVGSQVKPGTYRAAVPADSFGCYWERLKGASGSLDDTIANGLGEPGSQQLVTIKSTDKFFHTERCGTWTKVG